MDNLTALAIKQAKPKNKIYHLYDGLGLYLEIHPNGSKYWRMKYRFAGKEKLLAIGVFLAIGVYGNPLSKLLYWIASER